MSGGDPGPSDEHLPPGLAARFRVRRVLGAGGFGRVLEVHDPELNRSAALKLLHEELADEEVRRRFQREARVTAELEHPHVVRIYDFGEEQGQAYIVYELVPGNSLEEIYAQQGPLPVPELVDLAAQVAGALQAAHRAGVLHRDLKPANLLRRETGEVVLCDFGIARSDRKGTMVTPDGLVLGTPAFMAPELFFGELPSPASDQFGLAATLHLLAGAGFVYGTGEVAPVLRILQEGWRPEVPAELAGAAPAFAAALARALDPSPSRRFADTSELARALAGEALPAKPARTVVLGGAAPASLPATPPAGLAASSRARPLLAGGLGLACLLGGGLLLLRGSPAPERPAIILPSAREQESRAWKEYGAAARAGDVEAQARLGFAYSTGTDIPRDDEKAQVWLQLASDAGHRDAPAHLGRLRWSHAADDASRDAARLLLEEAVRRDSASGRYFLGARLLDAGTDTNRALELLEEAAARRDTAATVLLAELHEKGARVPRNPERAFQYYLAAAEQGSEGARRRARELALREGRSGATGDRARSWLERAEALGSREATVALAVPRVEAGELEAGTPAFAALLETLESIQASRTKLAEALLKRAEALQVDEAVSRDAPSIARLLRASAALGYEWGKLRWADALLNGRGAARDEGTAVAMLRGLLGRTEGWAEFTLAHRALFEGIEGVGPDEALGWLRNAVTQGNPEARRRLEELEAQAARRRSGR